MPFLRYKTFMRKLLAIFPLVLLFAACATTKVDWNSRVGLYTFDDAIGEMGVPDRQATLTDGSTVAEWLVGRGGALGHVHHFPGRFHTYDVTEFPDRYLRLTFGPDRILSRANNFSR